MKLNIFFLAIVIAACNNSSNQPTDKTQRKDSIKSVSNTTTVTTSDTSIAKMFLKIPFNKIWMDINVSGRDSLIKYKTYADPSGTSEESVEYTLTYINDSYLCYEMDFTTGQAGYVYYEMRKFRKKDGGYILVLSSYGGAPHAGYSQGAVKIFNVINGKLTENKGNVLPENYDLSEFRKEDTPDSVWKKSVDGIDYRYNLSPQSHDKIVFNIEVDQEYNWPMNEKYLKGYSIEYTWNGETFSNKMILK